LSQLVDEPAWVERVERTLAAFGDRLNQLGRSLPMMAAALSTHHAGLQQIVVIEGREGQEDLGRVVGRHYLPFAFQLHLTGEQRRRLGGSLPFIAAMDPVDGMTTVYVCRDRACRAPATTMDDLEGALTS
jgi:uncharacterized protein YyaL (SSP411 family)